MTTHRDRGGADGAGTRRRRPRRRWTAAGLVAVTVGAGLIAGSASAELPAFPNNIVVFPDRDFISAEGFGPYAGQVALVQVDRPGVGVTGAARVLLRDAEVPFEVNHPGEYCWGWGPDMTPDAGLPQVTPDILPGDVVRFTMPDGRVFDTTTQDAYVTDVALQPDGVTLVITGHIASGIDRDNTEQRVVVPEIRDTAVGRRDIRALPGPPVDDDSGAYRSGMSFSGETFTATYVFDDPDVAAIAAGGGARFMTWQVTDPDGNRQGLTIAEFDEVDGPGFSACPNGPLKSGPAAPTDLTAVAPPSGGTKQLDRIKVDWTPAAGIPGTPTIDGYRVVARARSATPNPKTSTVDEHVEIGRRVMSRTATGTTILLPTGTNIFQYDVYVQSFSEAGETFPPRHVEPVDDVTAPVVTATPAGGTYPGPRTVGLSVNEPNADVYYTLDGTSPVIGGALVSATAIPYGGPFEIADDAQLQAVAFDSSGNASEILVADYVINADALPPDTPDGVTGTAGLRAVTVGWNAVPGADSYRVTLETEAGAPVGTPQTVDAPAVSATFTDLAEGVPVFARVAAVNEQGTSPDSQRVGPMTPFGDVVANAGADRTVTRVPGGTPVTLDGSGSTPAGATYAWTLDAPDPRVQALTGATTLAPSFTIAPYTGAARSNAPITFRLAVTVDGETRTDTVAITPAAGDAIGATVRWKVGDFRIDGTGTVNGSVVTVRTGTATAPGTTVVGTATVAAGVWQVRLRNGALTTNAGKPAYVWIESNLGATPPGIRVP